MHPDTLGVLVVDSRWDFQRGFVERSYNISLRSGDKHLVAAQSQLPIQIRDRNPVVADDHGCPTQREDLLQAISSHSIAPGTETEFGVENPIDEVELSCFKLSIIWIGSESRALRFGHQNALPSERFLQLENLSPEGV